MTDTTDIPGRKPDGAWAHLIHVLRENPVTMLSFGMFAFFVLQAFFGAMIVPHDPLATNAARALQPPDWTHWFGTDSLGATCFPAWWSPRGWT